MKYQWALCGILAAVVGCKVPGAGRNLPPAERLMHPGPGMDGPGPGVMAGPGVGAPVGTVSQILFNRPDGMIVNWDVAAPGQFDSEPLVCPGRVSFSQGAIYRLKLTNILGREGVELYPTLEVAPSLPRTDAYLAHTAVPVEFTEEDFDQVLSGNFVTKVVYLPDPEYQELALAGVETLVSTRLDPGLDPIVEADRRGAILAVIRIGNKDLQVAGGEQTVGGAGYGVVPAGYIDANGAHPDPSLLVSGMTAPQYGMPITGTPVGLPGPPHIPLGIPAGLQQHVMRNHTFVHVPQPTERVKIDVKQSPGMTYPRPANRVHIHEWARAPWLPFSQPWWNKHKRVRTEAVGAECAEGCPPGEAQ